MIKLIAVLLILFCSTLILSQGYICAVGGGSEDYNDWSDEPYSWIVQKADSGRILILSYDDETNWIPDYFKSLGASEAVNVKIYSRTIADQQIIYDSIISAKAVFIKGGDQYRYISLWKGTKTEEAINYLYKSGGVVAGTSAGAAVLGNIDFSAKNGSAYPAESLKDPFYRRMAFEDNFLNLATGIIFDTHFIERGRFGRLIPMLLNIYINFNRKAAGVGIDDHTALCINPDLTAEVKGSGAVSVFYQDNNTFMNISDQGYIIEGLRCNQMTDGWAYDFKTHTVISSPPSAQYIIANKWTFPKASFMLSSGSTFDENKDALKTFLQYNEAPDVLILSHDGYKDKAEVIRSFIESLGYNDSVLLLNTSSANSEASVLTIRKSSKYVFAGDSLAALNILTNSNYDVSKEFLESISSGKPVFFIGNTGKLAGSSYVDNTDTDYLASWRGKMTMSSSLSVYRDMVFQPSVFNDEDFYENRSSSVLWGMMRSRSRLGVYLNNNDYLFFNAELKSVSGSGGSPFIIVDASNTTMVDSSTYKTGAGPRQVVAMDNLRYYVSNRSDISFSLENKTFTPVVSVNINQTINKFYLEQNYPNPFNPETTFRFYLDSYGFISFRIYDLLGREIAVLINKELPAGEHNIKFNAEGVSSGVYIAVLNSNHKQFSRKIMVLK